MRTTVIVIILLVASSLIYAGNGKTRIIAETTGDGITFRLKDIPLPDNLFSREIRNGLPNDIVVMVVARCSGRILSEKSISYSITYDLWDENYRVNITDDGGVEKREYKNVDNLVANLSDIEIRDVIESMDVNDVVSVSLQVIYNPVEGDRVKRIQQWVNNNREHYDQDRKSSLTPVSESQGSSISINGPRSRGPRFKKLFDQILEQYASDADTVAQWRSKQIGLTVDFQKGNNEN